MPRRLWSVGALSFLPDSSPYSIVSNVSATVLCGFLLACCEIVVCLFRLGFTNFCARRLQIIARMTKAVCHGRSAIFVNKLPWQHLEGRFLLRLSVVLQPVPADEKNMAVAIKESEAVFVAGGLQEETCNLSTCGECLEFWFFGTVPSQAHDRHCSNPWRLWRPSCWTTAKRN